MKQLSDAALINELHLGRLSNSSIRLSAGMSNYRYAAGGQTGAAAFYCHPLYSCGVLCQHSHPGR